MSEQRHKEGRYGIREMMLQRKFKSAQELTCPEGSFVSWRFGGQNDKARGSEEERKMRLEWQGKVSSCWRLE